MTNDPYTGPEWDDLVRQVRAELVPKMQDSKVVVSLAPSDGTGDVKYYLELGASIMLDKPIVVVADPGQQLPEHLLRVADLVIYKDVSDPRSREELGVLLGDFVKQYGG